MKTLLLAGLMLGAYATAAPAIAKPSDLPPMNDFNFAYYTCEGGKAFQVSYESDAPKAADLTTSNNNKQYSLKRIPVAKGVEFTGQDVTFWTDGETVRLAGTEIPFNNCKLKSQ
jgi:membrane-bound inhibitor of C-type lysozyme